MSRAIDCKTLLVSVALASAGVFPGEVFAASSVYEHNGSLVSYHVVGDEAYIDYVDPRPGLSAAHIGAGTVLFDGRISRDGLLRGTAYTFAPRCMPAAYAVTGQVMDGQILLRGAAPRRARGGCEVVGYAPASNHSVLFFRAMGKPAVTLSSAEPATVKPVALAAPTVPVDAPAPTPAVATSQAAPVAPVARVETPASEYDRLFDAYLNERETLQQDAGFARAFAQYANCNAFAQIRGNEFERARFDAAAPAFLQKRGLSRDRIHLRLAVKLGAYDFAKQAFAFRPLNDASSFEIAPPRDYGCGAQHAMLPEGFAVRFSNADLADGVAMPSDQAEPFVKSRISPSGLRDDNIVMDVEVEIAGRIADPREVETGGLWRRRQPWSAVTARIVDYSLFANDRTRTPFARLSEDRKRSYADAKAREQAEAEADAKENQTFSDTLLAQQFETLKTDGKIGTARRTRFARSSNLTRDVSQADGLHFKVGQLAASFYYEHRDSAGNRIGPQLQFTNPNPIDVVELPAEIARRVNANPSAAIVNRLYQPVGIIDDDAARRAVVMVQIVGIEIETSENGQRFRHVLPIAGDLKPFVFKGDERAAAAFEVMGVKAGASVADVRGVIEAQGKTADYEEPARVLRTGGVDCASWTASGQSGEPCVIAEFDVTGRGWFGGEKRGLTRMAIVQNMEFGQVDAFVAGLIKQYGEPRVRTTAGNITVLSWGAVVAPQRGVEGPARTRLHAAELEIRNMASGAATRFLLTDPAYFTSRNSATPAQKLSQR